MSVGTLYSMFDHKSQNQLYQKQGNSLFQPVYNKQDQYIKENRMKQINKQTRLPNVR
ncbi:hypothetical protein HanRHA438_Chr12g0551101 [Helianthus annuus]|nr:hypothetical protein HanIR_Chr12g0581861 [Helianthus annuus]KAJ0866388.1 hypothetical protein HanRHA438_Chr12g0551101 [Helianthus annuus]